jgi:hypothetical protein
MKRLDMVHFQMKKAAVNMATRRQHAFIDKLNREAGAGDATS